MTNYADTLRQHLRAHPETVNIVQEKNDIPSPPHTCGNTYLHLAVNGFWHPETENVVAVLLEYGADPNIPNAFGWTPLHLACQIDTRNKRIAELLLEHGACPHVLTRDGRSPMDLLADSVDPASEIAALLVSRM
jgi:ankyrin repeat protein